MDVEPPVTRKQARAGTREEREAREARGKIYVEQDPAAPHAGDTAIKSTARHVLAETRRAAAGHPSRLYLIVALIAGVLGLTATVWPRMAARIMLPSTSTAFALPEHSLASAAVAAAIEKAVGGKPVTSTSPTRARAWPSLPFLSARASALAPPNDTLFRLLGSTWLAAAAAAWSLRNASHHGKLSLATYRRLSLGLAASAAAELVLFPRLALNLSWTGLGLMTACALAKLMGPMRMLPGEGLKRTLATARRGLFETPHDPISLAWTALAPSIALVGLSYVLLPWPTARLILCAAPGKGSPTLALWQLGGASIASLLVPMALNLKVATDHGRVSNATHAMESLALAAVAGVHVASFARDLEHGRGSLVGTPLALGLWSLVGLTAAVGLPIAHAGEPAPQMRREE